MKDSHNIIRTNPWKMIKPNELRIGNYLDRNGLMEVIQINASSLRVYDHYNRIRIIYHFEYGTFKGIPLTEEWLLKLGTTKRWEGSFYISNIGIHLLPQVGSFNIVIGDCASNSHEFNVTDFKVHQLQNLYFALTGTELTINN